jgi:DNA-binding SARP family transcriptional activator
MAPHDAGPVARPIPPILVCLLGGFRLLNDGKAVPLRPGGRARALLASLALAPHSGVPRDQLLATVWPGGDMALAGQSLNTLVYALHRSLGDALAGRPPITHDDGRYRLNAEDGVEVDIVRFDAAVDDGDRRARAGDRAGAIDSYRGALHLYEGDLEIGSDVQFVLERERLRARYLSIRSRLADHQFADQDYASALVSALDLLSHDPCREDAHRMAMRCYVRLGERAQALRQYRVCESILAAEFEARPEIATSELFDLVRLEPADV